MAASSAVASSWPEVAACSARSAEPRTTGRIFVAVLGEDVAHLQLHELEQLGVGHVDLVDEHDHVLDADLAREQHVLARLLLRPLRAVDEQDRAVHLRRTRDHVLDVVGVARAIDVRVAPRRRLVLDVRGDDRDAALALLVRVVDVGEARGLAAVAPAATWVSAAVRVVLPWST